MRFLECRFAQNSNAGLVLRKNLLNTSFEASICSNREFQAGSEAGMLQLPLLHRVLRLQYVHILTTLKGRMGPPRQDLIRGRVGRGQGGG